MNTMNRGTCENCDALAAERDELKRMEDIVLEAAHGDIQDAQAQRDAALNERDDLAARLAAAEAATNPDATIDGIMGDLCDMEQEDPDHPDALIVHYDTLRRIVERWVVHGGIEPALAGSRERAATTTTRTITMRCHCGRGVTIGADPWCEGCVQSAATCDCAPVAATEGA